MPNFIKIGHMVAKIWRFYGFQNGRYAPSWICEIRIFLTVGRLRDPFCISVRTIFRKDRSKPLRRYRDFCDFPDGGCRHVEFSKIRNFNGLSAVGGQYTSSCQILSKSVKRLQRYGELTVFNTAAVRHLGFVKFEIFNGRSG